MPCSHNLSAMRMHMLTVGMRLRFIKETLAAAPGFQFALPKETLEPEKE